MFGVVLKIDQLKLHDMKGIDDKTRKAGQLKTHEFKILASNIELLKQLGTTDFLLTWKISISNLSESHDRT